MMLSTGLFSLTLFVDRTLLYRYSDQAAAGAMGAGTIFWAITCVPVTLFGYTSTFVAQYVGVSRADRAIRVVIQGFLLALATGPLVFAFAGCSRWFFAAFHEAKLVELETQYFHWIAIGAWATILSAPLSGLFNGTGRTHVLLGIDIIVTLMNALLDFLLIFGLFGFPRMGIVGAGLATSISLVVKLGLMLVAAGFLRWDQASGEAVDRKPTSNGIGLFSVPWRLEPGLISRLLFYGWPAAISSLAEAASFSIIMMMVGQLGETAMAATTLALNVNLLAFIPMFGLGMAVGVVVGQRLAEGKPQTAQRSVRSGLWIAVAYSSCFAIAYGIFPDQILAIYGIGNDPVRFAEMRPIVKPILWFIAVYCVFDAIQIVFVGALKGAGDTTYVLIGNVISGVVIVSLGILIGEWIGGGLLWWWGVITVWVLSLAVVFSFRYLHGGWMEKRVIEPELL
jgi:MATE family multidrug resistance protein